MADLSRDNPREREIRERDIQEELYLIAHPAQAKAKAKTKARLGLRNLVF